MKTKRGMLVSLLVVLVIVCALGIYCVEGFKAAAAPAKEPAKEPTSNSQNMSRESISTPTTPKSASAGIIGGGLGNAIVSPQGVILPGQNTAIPITRKVCGDDLKCEYQLTDGRVIIIQGTTIIGIQNPIAGSTPSPSPTPSPAPSSSKISSGPFSSTPTSTTCPNGEPSTTGCCPSGEPKGDYPCCPDGSRSRKGRC